VGALRLALLAVLGVVFVLLIVEEELFAGCKYELGATVIALQDSVGKLHAPLPKRRETR
jgi:selenophosphate synthetase-related protein